MSFRNCSGGDSWVVENNYFIFQTDNLITSQRILLFRLGTGKLIHTINHLDDPENSSLKIILGLNEKEIEFIKLACTEMTYKEIAAQMFLSPRTIDGYRDNLFEKLNVKSRVGPVMFVIKNGIVNV